MHDLVRMEAAMACRTVLLSSELLSTPATVYNICTQLDVITHTTTSEQGRRSIFSLLSTVPTPWYQQKSRRVVPEIRNAEREDENSCIFY
jgi:hypothetical protein